MPDKPDQGNEDDLGPFEFAIVALLIIFMFTVTAFLAD